MFKRLVLGLTLSALLSPALAQQYPTRAVRIIAPFAVGGPTDIMARIMAQKLTELHGQQFVVDNRVGAGGNIGIGLAANATPDGYTILVVSSAYVVNPGLYSKSVYDPAKSFIPISKMVASPNAFIANPAVAVKSMQDLVKFIQSNPKKFSMATPGIGTTPDLSAVLFRLVTKLDYPTACRLCGNNAGGSAHTRGASARAGGDQRKTCAGYSRCADHGGSRFSRAGIGHDARHAGARRHAAGNREAAACRRD